MSEKEERLKSPSASERFRASWDRLVRRSVTLAVLLHGALFLVSFSWRIAYEPHLFSEPEVRELALLPGFGPEDLPGTLGGVQDSVPAAPEEPEDPEDEEVASEESRSGPVVTAEDPPELWDVLGSRLSGRGALLPTLAEPELAPREEDAEEDAAPAEADSSTDQGDPSIGGNPTTIDLATLPEPDSLRLDRLSTLRPELAFMTTSAWVLIRNQSEVEAFLRRSYRNGRLDPTARGSVSVTLWIDRSGSVEWAEVSKSSGRPDLDEFTLALFNEVAAFRAARDRGVYVSRSVTFSVNYPW